MKTTQQLAEMALEYGWLCARLERPDFDAEDKIQRVERIKRMQILKALLENVAQAADRANVEREAR